MVDKEYLKLCQHILDNGITKEDRTGVGTRSVFGYQMRFNLSDGFPLLTTKKVNFNLGLNCFGLLKAIQISSFY